MRRRVRTYPEAVDILVKRRARGVSTQEHGHGPQELGNAAERSRISCRAGWNGFNPRNEKMPARSTASVGTALMVIRMPLPTPFLAAPTEGPLPRRRFPWR